MKIQTIVIASLFLICTIVVLVFVVFDVKTRSTYKPEIARETGKGIAVKTAKVILSDVEEVIGGNFSVEPWSTVDEFALVTSTVKSVNVEIGQFVNTGQPLIKLDDRLFMTALTAADTAICQANTALEQNNIQYQRIAELYSKRYVSRLELEQAELACKTSESALADAMNALERARKDQEHTTVYSPIHGVVMQRKVNPGQSVKEGDPLITIGNIYNVYVAADIAEEKLSRISLNQNAEITFDSFPNLNVTGTVYKIDPTINTGTRIFKVFIKLANDDYRFKPGLAGYVRLKYQFKGLVIPSLALLKNQNEATVFVMEGDRARLRKIKVDKEFYDKVEVVDGLKPGDEVIYYGMLDLKEGDRVNPQAYKE